MWARQSNPWIFDPATGKITKIVSTTPQIYSWILIIAQHAQFKQYWLYASSHKIRFGEGLTGEWVDLRINWKIFKSFQSAGTYKIVD